MVQPASVQVERGVQARTAPETAETPAVEETPAEQVPTTAPETAEATPSDGPERRELDPQVRDILREEGEREARLRRTDSAPVETQEEMPLDPEPGQSTRRRPELEAATDAFDAEDAEQSRRDLLPDIEEINSTLRATGDRSAEEEDASDVDTLHKSRRRRSGVRLGFLLVLIFAIGGAMVYSNATEVVAAVPQAEPFVAQFTDTVNVARFWLDDMARMLASETSGG